MPRIRPGPGPAAYKLPTVVGYEGHDCTRYRNPKWSMASRFDTKDKEALPGPHYDIRGLTNMGKLYPPAYSLKSRVKDFQFAATPGPNAYNILNVPPLNTKIPPSYSIRSRFKSTAGSATPGPNAYLLPSTIGPTIPDLPAKAAYSISSRGKDALAQSRSPGPATYNVPTEKSHPAYTMGPRVFPPDNLGADGPGPIYMPKLPQKPGYSFGVKLENDPYVTAADHVPCTYESC
ncbi:unnamed protein product [Brassicogethes aeneus]|uniref:Outer dense fiber protein 3 n=1 Tax=Brassicogethes aeneus TaxID=1431903 RepID=A0A9P0AXG7_BRAAE|nr:unnamed protein product [Brassicogethes aeneus]